MAIGLYGPEGLQWAGGGNAAGVQVFVFLPGTTTKAVLYLDSEGEFSLANPITSDQSGRIAFYAQQGSYDLVINSTRFAINISDNVGDPPPKLVQLADVQVSNPVDGQAVVWEAATSRWKNKTIASGGGGGGASTYPIDGKVFSPNDYGAVGDGVTDDYTAVKQAWDAAWAWLQAAPTVQEPYRDECTFYIPFGKHYRVDTSNAARLQTAGQTRAILPIPMISRTTSNKKTLRIMGAGEHYVVRAAELAGTPRQVNPPCSLFFDSGATVHAWSGSTGLPCAIGATDADMTDFEGNTFSNVHITLQDITLRQDDNPSLCAVNLEQVSTCRVERVRFDVVTVLDAAPLCTNKTGAALLTPRSNNNVAISLDKVVFEGYYTGFPLAEHGSAGDAIVLRCTIGIVNRRPNSHHGYVKMLKVEQCPYGLTGYDPATTGVRKAYGWSGEIAFLDFEDYAYNGDFPEIYAPIYPGSHFWDEDNVVTALVKMDRINSEPATPTGIGVVPLGETNSAYVRGTANKLALWNRKQETAVTRLSNDPAPPAENVSLFGSTAGPGVAFDNGGNPICMCIEFRLTAAGDIRGLRYWRATASMPTNATGRIYKVSDQSEVAGTQVTFDGTGIVGGWVEELFATPVVPVIGDRYIAEIRMPNGFYTSTASYFDSGAGATGVTSSILRAENFSDFQAPTPGQGSFKEGVHGFPTNNGNGANYWVDVIARPS